MTENVLYKLNSLAHAHETVGKGSQHRGIVGGLRTRLLISDSVAAASSIAFDGAIVGTYACVFI